MNLFKKVVCIYIVLTGFCGGSFAADRIGVIGAANQSVFALDDDKNKRDLKLGDDIFFKETIGTNETGNAQLLFVDRSALTVGPNSSVIVDEFIYNPAESSGNMVMRGTKGTFRFIGGALSKKEAVKIKTPVGTIGIRGGIAIVSINPASGATNATFVYGEAMTFRNLAGMAQTVTDTGNGLSVVTPTSMPVSFQLNTDQMVGQVQELAGRPGTSAGTTQVPTEKQIDGGLKTDANQGPSGGLKPRPVTEGAVQGDNKRNNAANNTAADPKKDNKQTAASPANSNDAKDGKKSATTPAARYNDTVKTTTTTNKDGSVTTTRTDSDGGTMTTTTKNGTTTEKYVNSDGGVMVRTVNSDGSVKETYTGADGSKFTSVRNSDGSMTHTNITADGSKFTTITNSDGSGKSTSVNPDGSVNTNTYKSDGTNVNTITRPDGTSMTETRSADGTMVRSGTFADGSKFTTTIRTDGTAVTTQTDASGRTTTTSGAAATSGTYYGGGTALYPANNPATVKVTYNADGSRVETHTDPYGGGTRTVTTSVNGTVTETFVGTDGNTHTTITNPDGSTQNYGTGPTGTSYNNTVNPDGSSTITGTTANGTSYTTITTANGTTTTTYSGTNTTDPYYTPPPVVNPNDTTNTALNVTHRGRYAFNTGANANLAKGRVDAEDIGGSFKVDLKREYPTYQPDGLGLFTKQGSGYNTLNSNFSLLGENMTGFSYFSNDNTMAFYHLNSSSSNKQGSFVLGSQANVPSVVGRAYYKFLPDLKTYYSGAVTSPGNLNWNIISSQVLPSGVSSPNASAMVANKGLLVDWDRNAMLGGSLNWSAGKLQTAYGNVRESSSDTDILYGQILDYQGVGSVRDGFFRADRENVFGTASNVSGFLLQGSMFDPFETLDTPAMKTSTAYTNSYVNNVSGAGTPFGYMAGFLFQDVGNVNGSTSISKYWNTNYHGLTFAGSGDNIQGLSANLDKIGGGTSIQAGFGINSSGGSNPSAISASIAGNVYALEQGKMEYGGTNSNGIIDGALITSSQLTDSSIQCSACNYVHWGVWAAEINNNVSGATMQVDSTLMPYISGQVTPTMPSTGTAVYSGIAIGNLLTGATLSNVQGTLNATINLDGASSSIAANALSITGIGNYTLQNAGIINVGSGSFSGAALDTAIGATTITGGSINGALFGPSANNLGGNFQFNDSVNSVQGTGVYLGAK